MAVRHFSVSNYGVTFPVNEFKPKVCSAEKGSVTPSVCRLHSHEEKDLLRE